MKKNFKRYIALTLTLVGILFFASCTKKFEEMNENKMNPKGTDIGPLFNGVVSSLVWTWDEQFYLNNEIFYPETELGALISESWGNYSIGIDAVWNNYYLALANIHDIDKRLDEICTSTGDSEIDDKVRAQLTVLEAFKTFKITDMFGDIPYSEAGYIWYNTETNRKPKYDSQESIYKTLLNELVWARDILNSGSTQTSLGNAYYSLGAYDVLYHNDYTKWGKIANSLILRHALRMYDKDAVFAEPLLKEAYDKSVIEDSSTDANFVLWPQYLGTYFGDQGWSFREHRNLRMGETVFAQMSKPSDTEDNTIFDPRVYIFFDTNHDGAWRAYPQIKDANTPTEGGTPYFSTRDNNYTFKGPQCLYSPFNYYLIRDHVFVPQIMMSAAEESFIKAEISARGIAGSEGDVEQFLYDGVCNSLLLWLQLPYNGTPTDYKYIYSELQQMMKDKDLYDLAYGTAGDILNDVLYMKYLESGYTSEVYLEVIYQQRWLDLFRQPNEAWSLARRTFKTPTTIDHSKLVTYRLPYPQSEVTYNYDNYNEQVKKMSHGDTRETKVWWMK